MIYAFVYVCIIHLNFELFYFIFYFIFYSSLVRPERNGFGNYVDQWLSYNMLGLFFFFSLSRMHLSCGTHMGFHWI